MINKEIIVIILVTAVVGLGYRWILEDIFKENVGDIQQRDIDSLLPWRIWFWGRYMNSYIQKYKIRYHILQFYYHMSIVVSTILLFCIIIPVSKSPDIKSGIEAFTYIYAITLIAAVYFIPWKFLGKDNHMETPPKPTYTFHEAVERFQAAQQVWDTIPPKGHRGFRKKILKELQSRAIDMQPPLVNEWLRIVGWSEEKREAGVKYAWDCLCEVEELSAKMGMPRNMRKESLIFMTYEDLEQRFEQAMSDLQQADSEEEQNRCRKRAIVAAAYFARRMKEFHHNNVAGHRDDSSAIIEQYQIFQDMLNRAGDCSFKAQEQDLFDSIQDIYNFSIQKQDI